MEILEILGVLRDVSLIIAVFAGGVWGLYRFRKMRIAESKLEIEMIPEVYANVKSKVVDTVIRLRNVGDGALYVNVPNPKCTLEIKGIPDSLTDSFVHWDDSRLLSLLPPIELFKDFYSWYPGDPFIVEPKSTDTLHATLSTSFNGLVLMKTSIVDKDDYLYVARRVIDLRSMPSRT